MKLFVSNAPAATTVNVPAVGALGLTEAEAKAILAKYHLKTKVIDLETPDSKPGLCIYQNPAAGAEVKIGSVVSITVARKPQNTTTTAPPIPAGATRYDQTDTRIVKTGIWADYYATAASLGSYGRSSTSGSLGHHLLHRHPPRLDRHEGHHHRHSRRVPGRGQEGHHQPGRHGRHSTR